MVYLTKEQLSLLKRCATSTVDCKSLSTQELQIIAELEQNNFVQTEREIVPTYLNGMPNPYKGSLISAKISERGKAYFVEKSIDEKRFRKPYTVSILSLLIATLALLLSGLSVYLQAVTNTPVP